MLERHKRTNHSHTLTHSFQKLVDEWASAGAVREWTGPVGTLDAASGKFEAAASAGGGGSEGKRYVAAKGMAQLAEHLTSPVGD